MSVNNDRIKSVLQRVYEMNHFSADTASSLWNAHEKGALLVADINRYATVIRQLNASVVELQGLVNGERPPAEGD